MFYLIHPKAITVNERLIDNVRFSDATPRFTNSLIIGTLSTVKKQNHFQNL